MSRREELRLMAKVANLYYVENLKQIEVADRLDLSQAGVSRLLKRALKENIVRISVNTPSGYYPELEKSIRDHYHLKEVIVVDHSDDREQLLRNLGAGAAFYLENTIKANDFMGISCWSEALLATANAMHNVPNTVHVDVIQILGGLGSPNSESHASQLTRRFADLLNGEAIMLPAPGLVGTTEARDILMQDPYVQDAMKAFREITVALVGIGTVEPSRVLARSGNAFPETELETLRKAQAVGDICLRFFDETGSAVQTSHNNRVIGIPLETLKDIPRTIAVAGDERKMKAIQAALKGGWINILITDSKTAYQLLY